MLTPRKWNRFRTGQKGYLGPIGDDIPSLIPILVGLVTFFAAFTFTLNEYNARTASFSADRDTLVIANALKGDSYIATYPEFDSACKGLRVRGLNYAAGIVESSSWEAIADEAETSGLPRLAEMTDHIYFLNGSPLSCSAGIPPLTDGLDVHTDALVEVLENRPFVVLAFPLALQVEYAVVPATLVVITWKV
jgi:hypothetical protein